MPSKRLASGCALSLVLALPALAASAISTAPPAEVHPADRLTSALVTMGEAHVGDEVLSAWLNQQGQIPPLTGEQLARLKTAGLSDGILLQLVRGGEAPAAPAAEAPEPAPVLAEQDAAPPIQGGAKLRVLVQSAPSVEYCELVVDGKAVASRGEIVQGILPTGGRVPRAESLALRTPTVLYESDVAPGRHEVRTGFAVSRLKDESVDVRNGRRQRLVPEGVRALEDDAGTDCNVGPGELCVVTARFRKVDRSLLGGRPAYAVSYDTVVLSQGEADVQAAWATPAP